MFADAEVQVATSAISRGKVARVIKREARLGGWRQVRGTAHQPWNSLRNRVQHLLRRLARRHALRVGRERWQVLVPSFRKLAPLHAKEVVRQFRIARLVLIEPGHPLFARLMAALADPGCKVLTHSLGNQELRVLRPAIVALREFDLGLSQWLAM